mmetsp:Transcript_21737/g.43516  ORF Transcript_21737/g.43516 Transcript_21737/m.43516 type:complete len:505 (+) Transcript_21737:388-1902(+)
MLRDAIESSTTTITATFAEGICNTKDLGGGPGVQIITDLCQTLVYFDGDWTKFVNDMLDYTSKSYGDEDFKDRIAGSDNRLQSLQSTDLLIQSALVPNSRVRSNETADNDAAVYIGGLDKIFTVPISAAYIINASGTSYRYSTEPEGMDISISQTSKKHSFGDWEEFYLYPGDDGNVYTDKITESRNSLSPAFGSGEDSTLVQVAAISSAAAGASSPLAPSTFTQLFSENGYELEQQNATAARLKLFAQAVARVYNQPMFDKFAVCNQWPNQCSLSDGLFIDGGFVDNPSLVINVAQYQISGGDLDDTLRVILTNTNEAWGDDYQYSLFLQYFDSPINEGVEPGSFQWAPGMFTPYQSPQIFGDFMDESILDGLIEPIPDSNMTTALLRGITIDNPTFGIKAGQQVEILLVNLNEPITTYIATPAIVDYFTEPLADMTVHIAENKELANRIKLFVEPALVHQNDNDDIATPAGEPTSSAARLLLRPRLPMGWLLLLSMVLHQVL